MNMIEVQRIEKDRTVFTINTKNTTYQMMADEYGKLLHLYYGKSAEGVMDYVLMREDRGFAGNLNDAGLDRTYTMDELLSEFPERSAGDFRSPVFAIKHEDSSFDSDLRYDGYTIQDGKYSLKGLPAAYTDDKNKAKTLVIKLKDFVRNITVELLYGVIPEYDIITRAAIVTNDSDSAVYITKLQSACLDFGSGEYNFMRFYGRHAMERCLEKSEVLHGSQSISSRRGTSSHQYSPTMILADKECTEFYGSCYAMEFVYSGGFKGEVEKDQFNQIRMQLGLNDEMLEYPLSKGEALIAPEVIMTYSSEGLSKLSNNLHKCINNNIVRGKYKNAKRPVLVNSWEAAYFDFNADTIVGLAKEAAAVGIDLVVMDDGWFGRRNDDNSSLGDWDVNEKKLGCTLKELAEKVNKEGTEFGIWIEPEMVNEDSDFYRNHPDYALCFDGRKPIRSRNQLVLDFSRKEVVDAVFDKITSVFDGVNISYVKWDMNRSLLDVYSASASNQGKVLYDYVLGLYDFLERMLNRYPNMLIEGCSGGGGRFDSGMLYYTPQIWCSDNTDAIDRLKIQYGTSFGYPVSSVGSHVSAVPNHQTGRSVSIDTRGVVAMSGSFGYELDLGKLSEEEKEKVREQVKAYKEHEMLIKYGDYFRLSNPFSDDFTAWAIVSEDKREALVFVVITEISAYKPRSFVRIKGLKENTIYKETGSNVRYSSSVLSEVGLPVQAGMELYKSYMWHFVM